MCFYAPSMCCPVPPAVRTRRQGLPDPELFRGSHWRGRAFLGSLSRWRCEMLRAQRMNSSLICTSSHQIISIFFLKCGVFPVCSCLAGGRGAFESLPAGGRGNRTQMFHVTHKALPLCWGCRGDSAVGGPGAGLRLLGERWVVAVRCVGLGRTRGLLGQVQMWCSS